MKNDHHPLSLRIPSERLALIDKRAKRLGLTRTDFMVRSARLDRSRSNTTTTETRNDEDL